APAEERKPEPPPAPASPGKVGTIGLEALFEGINGPKPPLIYDARLSVLYHLGHLPGARSLPVRSVEKRYPKVRQEIAAAQAEGRAVVFYCIDANCPDAHNAAVRLAEKGIDGLLVFEGGMEEWKAAGMEVE